MEQMKITKHGKSRAKERKGVKNHCSMERCIRLALERGKGVNDFKSREREYLINKQNVKAVVYDGFCFLFGADDTLITLYPLPIWFANKKQYDGKEKIRNPKKYYRHHDRKIKNV